MGNGERRDKRWWVPARRFVFVERVECERIYFARVWIDGTDTDGGVGFGVGERCVG